MGAKTYDNEFSLQPIAAPQRLHNVMVYLYGKNQESVVMISSYNVILSLRAPTQANSSILLHRLRLYSRQKPGDQSHLFKRPPEPVRHRHSHGGCTRAVAKIQAPTLSTSCYSELVKVAPQR